MSLLNGVIDHYEALGLSGVWLGAKSVLTGRSIAVAVRVPGLTHPVHVRLRTQDLSPLRQVYVLSEYDWGFSPSPRVIIDAGAHIGMTSVFFASRYPAAMVIALEPDASNFAMLTTNVAPYANVIPVHAALWHEDADLFVMDPGRGHDAFRTAERPDKTAGAVRGAVRGKRLETILREWRVPSVDVLKVDIEGSEREVFERASAWIAKIDTVVIELHDRWKPGCREAVQAATRDFPFHWQRGETVVLARRAGAVDAAAAAPRKTVMRIVAESKDRF